MLWKGKKKSLTKIEIKFDREEGQIEVICNPPSQRPTEIIQLLLLAIETVNKALQEELEKNSQEIEPKLKDYIR